MIKNHYTNVFRVCVNSINDNRISGFIYGLQLNRPIPFFDIGNLLLTLDAIMDGCDFPQAFQKKRCFGPHAESQLIELDESKPLIEKQVFDSAAGLIATINISVITRQHTTWQGFVDFHNGLPKQSFRSAMELIRQIDWQLFGKR